MDQNTVLLVVAIVVLIGLAVLLVALYRKRRSSQLKEHFGTEYDRTVKERGDAAKAEAELINREKRVHSFSIKHLSPETRNYYSQEWATVQRRFVDDPVMAVSQADALVNRLMADRGYPMADFEQRAADISVNYPGVVDNYRAARTISQRHARGEAGTEDMRQAMVYYRSLFAELLDTPQSAAA